MTKTLEYLSHSRLEAYRTCSLKFAYQYIEKLQSSFVPSALSFGSAIHAACEFGMISLMSGDMQPVEELLAIFESAFDEQGKERPIRYGAKESRDSLLALAVEMLKAWVAFPRAGRTISVEHEFSVSLAPNLPAFHGRIDLIELHTNPDFVAIIDLKTSRAKWSEEDVIQHAAQLVLYREAVRELTDSLLKDKPVKVKLGFEVITKSAKNPTVERLYVPDDLIESIDRQIRSAEIVVRAVEHEIFLPSPGWQCFGCGFRKNCAKWGKAEQKEEAVELAAAK